jgi:type IV secretion system protein VirD4
MGIPETEHGASLWTFWQGRSQTISVYGEDDAATLLRTAEFVTVSDPAMVDPDEREY